MNNYIEDIILPEHYSFGTLGSQLSFPDRNWLTYLPSEEEQSKRRIETSNCTSFGTHNAQEGYIRRVYGKEVNFSDRYLGARAGTSPINGNSPHKVAEVQRNYAGFIPEDMFPFSSDIQTGTDYYKGVTFAHKLAGAKGLIEWESRHEWALDGTETNWQDKLYDALTFSPIGIAVDAWHKEGEHYYRMNENDGHWCDLVFAVKGMYWVVFDSYPPYIKKLEWNFGFTRAKRYQIFPREDFSLQFYTRLGLGFIQ